MSTLPPAAGMAVPAAPAASTSALARKSPLDDYPMRPDIPVFVAGMTLTNAALGAAVGAAIGYKRRQDPFRYMAAMGLGAGVFSLAFFGIREYAVSPYLVGTLRSSWPTYARRWDEVTGTGALRAPTIKEVRSDRLLDSSVTGSLLGAVAAVMSHRPRAIVGFAVAGSVGATLVQLGVNQAAVWRLKMLQKRMLEGMPPLISPEPEPVPVKKDEFGAKRRPEDKTGTSPLSQKILAVLEKVAPVDHISNEDYLAQMERRRVDIDKRLKEIEAEELMLFERAEALEKEKEKEKSKTESESV